MPDKTVWDIYWEFMTKVYQGLYQVFTFIPPSIFGLEYSTEYYVIMVGIWLVVFLLFEYLYMLFLKLLS